MDNMPSNFSLDEILKFRELPKNITKLIYEALDKILELKEEINEINYTMEVIQEQLDFNTEVIENIILATKATTKYTELSSKIISIIDNSSINISFNP